jgi:Bacterial Ig domain
LALIGLWWGKVRHSRRALAASVGPPCGSVLLAGLVFAGTAAASPAPVCAAGSCVTSFVFVGAAAQTWRVPVGVESAAFTVDGAAGGRGAGTPGNTPAAGGLGSGATATLSLSVGQTVTVTVGGAGANGDLGGKRGWPAGGAGGSTGAFPIGGGRGGAGGGFSSVALGTATELVGGGGGGGGGYGVPSSAILGGPGGAGGARGTDGGSFSAGVEFTGGGGGQPGVAGGPSAGPGAGGAVGTVPSDSDTCGPIARPGTSGSPGVRSNGGAGGGGNGSTGGGGGGGYYGGGGGGAGQPAESCGSGAGGGGGGASFAGPGLSARFSTGVQSGNGRTSAKYTDPITAASLSFRTAARRPLTVGAIKGVLSATSSPAGDPLTATVATRPAHGKLVLRSGGSFTYTPAARYAGADRFRYEAKDTAGDYAIATVHLAVTPRAPTVIITTPRNHATYKLGQVVRTRFKCAEGTGGPGLESCADQHGQKSGAKLDTASVGRHTLTVKAISRDGQTATASVSYVVARPPSG